MRGPFAPNSYIPYRFQRLHPADGGGQAAGVPYESLQRGRVAIPNHTYALTFCSANRRTLFSDDASARAVASALHRSADGGYCKQLAFVVMPDHVRWMVTITGKCSLAALMSATKAEASRKLQAVGHTQLPFWQRGFYEHRIRADEDLVQQARYLVSNPLRAGLVDRLVEYPHWFALWASPPHGPAPGHVTGEELLGP